MAENRSDRVIRMHQLPITLQDNKKKKSVKRNKPVIRIDIIALENELKKFDLTVEENFFSHILGVDLIAYKKQTKLEELRSYQEYKKQKDIVFKTIKKLKANITSQQLKDKYVNGLFNKIARCFERINYFFQSELCNGKQVKSEVEKELKEEIVKKTAEFKEQERKLREDSESELAGALKRIASNREANSEAFKDEISEINKKVSQEESRRESEKDANKKSAENRPDEEGGYFQGIGTAITRRCSNTINTMQSINFDRNIRKLSGERTKLLKKQKGFEETLNQLEQEQRENSEKALQEKIDELKLKKELIINQLRKCKEDTLEEIEPHIVEMEKFTNGMKSEYGCFSKLITEANDCINTLKENYFALLERNKIVPQQAVETSVRPVGVSAASRSVVLVAANEANNSASNVNAAAPVQPETNILAATNTPETNTQERDEYKRDNGRRPVGCSPEAQRTLAVPVAAVIKRTFWQKHKKPLSYGALAGLVTGLGIGIFSGVGAIAVLIVIACVVVGAALGCGFSVVAECCSNKKELNQENAKTSQQALELQPEQNSRLLRSSS